MDDQAPLKYRLLTGTGDREFCERVSEALEQGYELYGSPAVTFDGYQIVTAQAVVRTDEWTPADDSAVTNG